MSNNKKQKSKIIVLITLLCTLVIVGYVYVTKTKRATYVPIRVKMKMQPTVRRLPIINHYKLNKTTESSKMHSRNKNSSDKTKKGCEKKPTNSDGQQVDYRNLSNELALAKINTQLLNEQSEQAKVELDLQKSRSQLALLKTSHPLKLTINQFKQASKPKFEISVSNVNWTVNVKGKWQASITNGNLTKIVQVGDVFKDGYRVLHIGSDAVMMKKGKKKIVLTL